MLEIHSTKNLTFDKKTGEILKDTQKALFLDEEKLRKEEELDDTTPS